MQAVLGNHSFEGCAAVRLTIWSVNKATQHTSAPRKATSVRGGRGKAIERKMPTERTSHSEQPLAGHRDQGSETVRVWLLGGFRVSVGSRTIEEDRWRLRKARSLIKLLALSPGHRLHREQVMEALWPELGIHKASNNLHQNLHALRRTLEPSAPASSSPAASASSGYLLLRDEQLSLCPDSSLWVDVEAFEEAAATAHHAQEPQAFRAAIVLYAVELLPEDRYEPWVQERRAQLGELYLSLLVELGALYGERNEHESAIEALGRAVVEEPTREGAHVGLMRLYAISGRRREALSQYERLREVLLREIATEPEAATTRLQQEIWAGTFPPPDMAVPAGFPAEEGEETPTAASGAGGLRKHNLPLARTSFVGRERETLEVKRLLAMTRLFTLTGAAGCGKTRLAIKVARDLARVYPEGAWLVELAPLSEGELVPQAVARALGVREQANRPLVETLEDALRPRKMILVVDNCEHLIEAVVPLLDALLGSCPDLRILATSRETLNAAGEVNWVVPSLTMPDLRQDVLAAEELEGYESVRLFVERACQRDPAFVVSPENAQAVAEVCRRLDGIPLAIELAAARIGMLSAEQIALRLDDSLRLLTAGGRTAVPRHRTLRATLEWSFELLSEPERELFGRLSAFAGGFTLEAAEAVGTGSGIDEDDVLDLLCRLVGKSLVVADTGASRYRMLESVCQYARERLEEGGQAEAVRSRHAAWFLALAERAGPELRGPQQVAWLKRLDTEQDNVRAAIAWLLGKGESQTAARIGWALWLFWWMHGHFTEGRRWMEETLAKGVSMPAAPRAKALFVAGTMADGQADRRSARPLLEESLGLFRELRDKLGSALALSGTGLVAVGQGRYEQGVALFQEAVDLFLELGERWCASVNLSFSAVGWFGQGDASRAKRVAEQGLELAREAGAAEAICVACYAGALVAQAERDHERARELLQEGLVLAAEAGNETNVAYCLEGLAALAASEGSLARAGRLWGAAEALLEQIEVTAYIYAPDRSAYQDRVSAARAQLDEAAWQTAWSEGREMTPEQAVGYALPQRER